MKIKKGDNIIVIAGKDKGKKGKVVKALPHENKVVVESLNMRKKHQKPRRSNQKGQIVEIAFPIHASNVMLEDPKTGKPSRIRIEKKGEKRIRVAQKSGAEI